MSSHSIILSSGMRHNRTPMTQRAIPAHEQMPALELEPCPALDHPIRVSPQTIDRACALLDTPLTDRYRVVLVMLIGGKVIKPLCGLNGDA